MRCNFCGNTATTKTYRTWDGITGSSRECDDCAPLTNNAVLDRQAIYDEAVKDLGNANIVRVLNEAMDEFWNVVNYEIGEEANELEEAFKADNSMELYEDDLEAWRESMYNKISKTLKKQL